MRIKRVIYLSLVFIFFLTFPDSKAEELSFPDTNGKIVDQGEDYKIRLIESKGSGVKTAEAIFLIKAPPETVFKTVTDFNHYPEFMPNIKAATPVEKGNRNKKYKFTLKVAFWDINYVLLLKSNVKNRLYSLNWEFVEGDIRDTSGSWEIKQYDKDNEYSLILYRVRTDPGRFVPDWVADRLSTKSIPDMIKAVEKRSIKNN